METQKLNIANEFYFHLWQHTSTTLLFRPRNAQNISNNYLYRKVLPHVSMHLRHLQEDFSHID